MQDQFTTIDGKKIRYRDQGGSGMPVLLSHGIGGSLELWGKQLDANLPGLRLIAWDAPNHGLSDLTHRSEDFDSYAAWGLKLADNLGLDRFIAAGNSMGAAMALRMAALAPRRVAGLVLANAAALGPEVFPVFKLFSLPFLGELMTKPNEKGVDMQIKSIVKDLSVITPDLRAVVRRNTFKTGGNKAFLATLRSMTGFRGQHKAGWQKSHAQLAALTCPVLIIHGRHDSILPAKHSESAARMTPKAQLLVIESCGHTPQIEEPKLFNDAVAKFAAALA